MLLTTIVCTKSRHNFASCWRSDEWVMLIQQASLQKVKKMLVKQNNDMNTTQHMVEIERLENQEL